MYPITSLGGGQSEAVDVNNNDVVVGFSTLANGHTHAFQWQLAGGTGVITDLGTLGGANSWAVAINDDGIIVGRSETGGVYSQGGETLAVVHACAWYNGVIYDLGIHSDFYTYPFTDPFPFSEAVAINEDGVVAGNSYTINAHFRGFVVDLSPLTL
jgi:probable HAF family extracellular repeat protein